MGTETGGEVNIEDLAADGDMIGTEIASAIGETVIEQTGGDLNLDVIDTDAGETVEHAIGSLVLDDFHDTNVSDSNDTNMGDAVVDTVVAIDNGGTIQRA